MGAPKGNQYAKGHSHGRPSEYDPKFIDLVFDYAENPKKYGDPVPTLEGAAVECGVGKDAFLYWCENHQELAAAYKKLKSNQARLLQKFGLLNKTNALITKLMLSANHGMRERTENEQNIKGSLSLAKVLQDDSEGKEDREE